MYETSPFFCLRTVSLQLEVARFTLHNWGFSREYYIDLTLINPALSPDLAEMACFQVDKQFFHGFISSITENYSDQLYEIHIRLVSPLAHYLNHPHTRIYNEQSLEIVIGTILKEAGLSEGVSFETRIALQPDSQWLFQDNEVTLVFFNRLLALHQLGYIYQQNQDNILCIITDSIDSLQIDDAISLPLIPSLGLDQANETNNVLIKNNVCSKLFKSYEYNSQAPHYLEAQSQSIHGFAVGEVCVHGLPLKAASAMQSTVDEGAQKLQLTVNNINVIPGQEVLVKNSLLIDSKYHVYNIEIVGCQSQAMGTNNSDEKLNLSRLRVVITLSKAFYGASCLDKKSIRPLHRLHTAQVERHSNNFPDLSDKGEYHIRLYQDESTKALASSWVRNALYFSGNGYGFSHPLVEGSEVLTTFENGNPQRPMILGALPNLKNTSVVTQNNRDENIISTYGGANLLFWGTSDESLLELNSSNTSHQLSIHQNIQNSRVSLVASHGAMTIKSFNLINLKTKSSFYQYAKNTQWFWVEKDLYINSQKGNIDIIAKEMIRLYAVKEMKFKAKEQGWHAKGALRLESGKELGINVDKALKFKGMQGGQTWRSIKGNIQLKVRNDIKIKGGSSSLVITPLGMQLITSNLSLNAPAILGIVV